MDNIDIVKYYDLKYKIPIAMLSQIFSSFFEYKHL